MKWWLSRARGCQSGTGASSNCLLCFFLPLSHASVLFCLSVPGVRKRQTNRPDCSLLPVGWWSTSLTSHYLALGYSDSYIYSSCISPHGCFFLIQCPLKQKATLMAHTLINTHFYTLPLSFLLVSFLYYYFRGVIYTFNTFTKNTKRKRKILNRIKMQLLCLSIMGTLILPSWS